MKDLIDKATGMLLIDKRNWTKVKFGAVAIQQKKSVDRDKTNLTFYVKGEHMGSQDLHLREWGELTDEYLGPAFIRYFEKGDILYGSRRTYLRKVVLAPFEGITSNTTLVIKANEKVIDKRLLPFLMMSEGFTDHSIRNSKGSVNPYINWKDLANYEFLLPPKDEQARLAELLWAMDEVIEREKDLLDRTKKFEELKVKAIFSGDEAGSKVETKLGLIDSNWECVKLQELIDRQYITSHLDGNHGSYYPKNEEFVEVGVPYISANCIVDDGITFENAKYLTSSRANQITKGVAKSGDILLAHNATVGPVCILKCSYEKVILSTTLTYYRVNESLLNSTFLFYFMKSRLFQAQIERVMSQSTRNQVPITTQRNLYFILPPLYIQEALTKDLISISETGKLLDIKLLMSQDLQKSLINQIF
jgi:type I restriction enzyme S subunit